MSLKGICLGCPSPADGKQRPICGRTLKRILIRHHLKRWRCAKRIELTAEDAKKRLEFCYEYTPRTKQLELLRALFSDECTIQNQPGYPSQWVFRFAYERYREDLVNLQPHSRPRLSFMVWAMI